MQTGVGTMSILLSNTANRPVARSPLLLPAQTTSGEVLAPSCAIIEFGAEAQT